MLEIKHEMTKEKVYQQYVDRVIHVMLVIHGFHMLSGSCGLFENDILSGHENEHQMD